MSIVTVQLGQCGNQIGFEVFDTLFRDSHCSQGLCSKRENEAYQASCKERFFREEENGGRYGQESSLTGHQYLQQVFKPHPFHLNREGFACLPLTLCWGLKASAGYDTTLPPTPELNKQTKEKPKKPNVGLAILFSDLEVYTLWFPHKICNFTLSLVPVARAVLIDMEPKVINQTLSKAAQSGRWKYGQHTSFCQKQGSGNNWAYG